MRKRVNLSTLFTVFCLIVVIVLTSIGFCGCEDYEISTDSKIEYIEKPVYIEVEKPIYITQTEYVEVEKPVYIEVIKEVPVEKIEYVYVDKEIEVPVEVEKRVEVPVYIEVEKEIEVPVYIDKPVYVEVEKPIYVEVEKEVVRTEYVETPIYITDTKYEPNSINIVWADSPDFWTLITTPGSHIDYLAVYNCSDHTAGGCYRSYVLPCLEYSEWYGHYTYHWSTKGGTHNYAEYLNISCFQYKEGADYSQYLVNCTNRTSPGQFYNKDWVDADFGIGVYILTNVTVQGWHKTTTTYGSTPLSQTVLTYENAYTPTQLLTVK